MKTDVWTKQSTVKVLQDKSYGGDFRRSLPLAIKMAKGEYESGQLILTAKENVSSYVVSATDLVNENGDVLKASAIRIYNVKYIWVAEREGFEHGYFPDALLPFEKAVEYGENKILAGNNQSIWFTIKTDENISSGVYQGQIVLIVDGEREVIPFCVTVWDYAIPRETHVKTDLVIGSDGLMLGEGDYSPQTYRKYVERIIEHRCAPHRVVQDLNPAYIEGADFVKAVRELTVAEKPYLSTIMIPVYRRYDGVNEELYFRYVDALADACVEDNVNYFERAAVYCGFIDEPHLNGTWDLTNSTCKRLEELKRIAAKNFVTRCSDSALKTEVEQGILHLGNFVTSQFDERLTEVVYWCPGWRHLQTAEARAAYLKEGYECWWYGCGGVSKDVPSYAIGQPTLLDARIMNWMQFDYGIKGSLYWETVMYYKWIWCQEIHVNLKKQIDCYKEAGRCANNEGDGFLFYPGKPYGIDGPVDSIRIQAIRDGIEDYESLWLLERLYNQVGKSAKDVLKGIYERLYDGVKIVTDGDEFELMRERVANLIIDAKKGVYY